MKRQYTEWKVFANDVTDKGLISKMYKQLNNNNKKTQNLENGNRNIHINNNLECKWIKCPNQKTQTG